MGWVYHCMPSEYTTCKFRGKFSFFKDNMEENDRAVRVRTLINFSTEKDELTVREGILG